MSFWNDPLKVTADWLEGLLTGLGLNAIFAHVLVVFLGILVLLSLLMVLDIFLVWLERKVVARFQDRFGPNRVGPFGLIQPFADIIKLIIKEDTTPDGADKVVYNIAPILSMMSVLILWAVVPIAPVMLGVDLNVGVLFLVAAGALGALSIIMAGWSSNNKFALIGGFRQVAMMVAFEIPMLTMLLIPTIFAGSMNMNAIIMAQDTLWYFVLSPLGALIFLIAVIAELGRAPFDLAEGESELVAGFNTEYSGMKFGMFYAGELLHAMTFGGIWAILFFGGYRFFGLEQVSPCDPGLLHQVVIGLLDHHVDQVHHAAYPHRPDAHIQLGIPDAIVLCALNGDSPGERASARRPNLGLRKQHVPLERHSHGHRAGACAFGQQKATHESGRDEKSSGGSTALSGATEGSVVEASFDYRSQSARPSAQDEWKHL
jgi:NADH-quinone oxidoreductase subunit H